MRRGMMVVAAILLLTACASSGERTGTRSPRNVITLEQIEGYHGDNAYLLVKSLHPSWLRERGRQSLALNAPVVVYMDGLRAGTADSLRDVDPRRVARIQYLDARAATSRYGTGHANGAIMVTTR